MSKIVRNEDAFTGLEAAIVLIAFVVVAAVFSYVVLGAGFFTTQKSQEVVHTGTEQASSSMEVIGNVYGIASSAGDDNLDYIKFTVGTTAGGGSLDITKMVVSYADEEFRDPDLEMETKENQPPTTGKWRIMETLNADTDDLLEPGEQFVIGVDVSAANLAANKPFTVSLQPSVGAVMQIKRHVPAYIEKVNILR